MGLVSVCDIVVASENVNFCLSEAKLGLLPATIAPYVVMAMGQQAARRYFVTAEKFTARQAQAMGLVHELCELERLDETIDAITSQIVANGPMAVRACKRLVKDVAHREINESLMSDTATWIAEIRTSDEAQARMKSFLEKK
jgi:methylglutaconyl-CoA hydratase